MKKATKSTGLNAKTAYFDDKTMLNLDRSDSRYDDLIIFEEDGEDFSELEDPGSTIEFEDMDIDFEDDGVQTSEDDDSYDDEEIRRLIEELGLDDFDPDEEDFRDHSHGHDKPMYDQDEAISHESQFALPGASGYVDDGEEEEPEEEEPKTWEKDRDPSCFMKYVTKCYPGGIPSHDGTSTLGCERAVMYLVGINKEISEALRADKDDVLDLSALERMRVSIIKDVAKLKEHAKKLNKKLKTASDEQELVKESFREDAIVKEATTPKIQLIMTPFERAITGILVNSVVSAGKPFESVYDFLKEKYKFTDREELSILQILMDMGHPIFKDRGTVGESSKDREGHGTDFVKNYFA